MKTTQTAINNETPNGHAVNRITEQKNNRALREKKRDEREKEIMAGIEAVHEYNNYFLGRFGFGFRLSDGALVSFSIPAAGLVDDFFDSTSVEKMTWRESLEWVEHLHFADQYFGDPMQEGPGYRKWICGLRSLIASDK
jgi:hypothetical protein